MNDVQRQLPRRRVLFVDDDENLLSSLQRMLHDYAGIWEMAFACSAADAMQRLADGLVDVVITDVLMPVTDGFDLLLDITTNPRTASIPVIMLTGVEEEGLKQTALELGAADLLNKPVQRADLLARIRSALTLKSYHDELIAQNVVLERLAGDRTAELEQSRLEIVWTLARAAEQHAGGNGHHVVRIAAYSRAVAAAMGLEAERVDLLALASPLYDVGTIAIPEPILRKRGTLTDAERRAMERHCEIGERILNPQAEPGDLFQRWHSLVRRGAVRADEGGADGGNPLLEMAATIALTHHERWDGAGYPQGLSGEQIPIEARIVALVDVYDALRSTRPYKPAYSAERAASIISEEAGKHFDPEVYAAFAWALRDLQRITDDLPPEPEGAPAARPPTQALGALAAPAEMPAVPPLEAPFAAQDAEREDGARPAVA